MAGSKVMRVCSCEFCDRDDLTPQGVREHQRWCDENPYPGVSPEKQEELREKGVID
jgi:hypothetical protein